jgi:hypothetical protein
MEAVLGAGAQPAEVAAMEKQNARGGPDAEQDDRERVAVGDGEHGERDPGENRRDRGVAEDQEEGEPHRARAQRDPERDAEEDAAAGRDHLPALLEPQEDRAPVTEHRRGAGAHSREMVRRDEEHPNERRDEPLQHVEEDDRDAEPAPVGAPDVRRADVPGADLADVLVLDEEHEPIAPRARAQEIAEDNEPKEGHQRLRVASEPGSRFEPGSRVSASRRKRLERRQGCGTWGTALDRHRQSARTRFEGFSFPTQTLEPGSACTPPGMRRVGYRRIRFRTRDPNLMRVAEGVREPGSGVSGRSPQTREPGSACTPPGVRGVGYCRIRFSTRDPKLMRVAGDERDQIRGF